MEYLTAGLALIFSGLIGIISFMFVDYLKNSDLAPSLDGTASGSVGEKAEPALNFRMWKTAMTKKRIIFLCSSLLLNCYAYYRVFTFDLNMVAVVKVFIVIAFLMSAMFVDQATKKIPNFLILTMLGTEVIFILFEFLFERDIFVKLLIASGIGFAGSFLFMIIISLLTKGGIGMGDVKLIAALGLLVGISGAFYTLVYAELLCFLVSLFMIFFAKKNLKYSLPFGPFIYYGFLAAAIFGTF